jgi:cytochrome c oxidase subunit 2
MLRSRGPSGTGSRRRNRARSARGRLPVALLAPLVALAVAGTAAAANGGFTPPDAHSPNAHRINNAYYFVLGFTAFIFLVVEVAIVVFVIRYRNRGRPRTAEGAQVHGHTRLEVIWTVTPVLILVAIGTFIFVELPGISGVPAKASSERIDVRVDAHQFYWQYTYPNGAISIDNLRAPVGKVVYLKIYSQDVNHSWWVPQLAGKTDAIPGRVNHTWFKAERAGTYYGQCSEFCGIFHEARRETVTVLRPADYERYVTQQASGDLGRAEWHGVCAKCHGLAGQGYFGPALAANSLLVQPAGLEGIVRNGRNRMPAVGNNWTPQQFRSLLAYVKKHVYKGAASGG